jgi:hypothetical protein
MRAPMVAATVFSALMFTSCGKGTQETNETKETKEIKEIKAAKETATFTGKWLGHVESGQGERETAYLELNQEGTKVTGKACEEQGGDCHEVLEGKVDGAKLTFHGEFEGNGEKISFAWELHHGDDGQLKGTVRNSVMKDTVYKVSLKRQNE